MLFGLSVVNSRGRREDLKNTCDQRQGAKRFVGVQTEHFQSDLGGEVIVVELLHFPHQLCKSASKVAHERGAALLLKLRINASLFGF